MSHYLLADDAGLLAQFIPPGFLAALAAPERSGVREWVPVRFMGQAALSLGSVGGDAPGEADTVFVAFGAAAWRALAGRDVPALQDGPLRLTFPRMPEHLPWTG